MKIILCGLTGLGNVTLEELIKLKINVTKVYSRVEKGKYPYFDCENISHVAKKNNIPVSFNSVVEKNIDLCLVTTFHKKINLDKSNFKKAINIHPSYLPLHKGRDPINDAIANRSKFIGVTAFHMTNILDEGKIIVQEKINLGKFDKKADILKKMIPIYRKFTKFIVENLENLK
jgi:methionyl-tRNA formyltransferase